MTAMKRAKTELKRLFELELRYDQDAIECAPIGQIDGKLVGSGSGRVDGPGLSGAVRWSNYEHTLRQGLCSLQLPGTITTDDGVELRFEARGLARYSGAPTTAYWRVAGAFQFETDDPRYEWLVHDMPVWIGEFNMDTLEARYQVFSSVNR